MNELHNFSWAMAELKQGEKLVRNGWNGNGMYCITQFPDENSKMTHPYLVMFIPECREGDRLLPWQPAQVDLFASDWKHLQS